MSVSPAIRHRPSGHDRMDRIERILRWWRLSLQSALAPEPAEVALSSLDEADFKRRRIRLVIPAHAAFTAELTLPLGTPRDHERALNLRADSLLPTSGDRLRAVFGALRKTDGGRQVYLLAALSCTDMATWEDTAIANGAASVQFCVEGHNDLVLITAREARTQTRSNWILAAIAGCSLVLALALLSAWTARTEASVTGLAQHEDALRRQLLQAEQARARLQSKSQIAEGYLHFGDASTLRADLAALAAALPAGVAAQTIHWRPTQLELLLTQPSGPPPSAWAPALDGWQWSPTQVESDTVRWIRTHEARDEAE